MLCVRRAVRVVPSQPGSFRSSGAHTVALPLPVWCGPTAEPPEPAVHWPGVRILLSCRSDQAGSDSSRSRSEKNSPSLFAYVIYGIYTPIGLYYVAVFRLFVFRMCASLWNPSLIPLVLIHSSLLLRSVVPFQDVRYKNISLCLSACYLFFLLEISVTEMHELHFCALFLFLTL